MYIYKDFINIVFFSPVYICKIVFCTLACMYLWTIYLLMRLK